MGRSGDERTGLTRGELLKSAAFAAPGVLLGSRAATASARARAIGDARAARIAGMNIVVFLTDQDRAIQHFPRGWAERNLPGYARLARNGLAFRNAFTDACMCTPARATLVSGYFPAQHGCKYTLELDMPAPQYPQVELPRSLKNIASVMRAAGYNVVYKGKWHLSKPRGSDWAPSDVGQYGFTRWNPPDAGANQDISEAGGGTTDNDGRFMDDDGAVRAGDEGVLEYLNSVAARQQPFFLIVSLVNPHDVLLYPKTYQQAGYDASWLEGEIGLPATVNESLSSKPTVQRQFLRLFNLTGPLRNAQMKRDYLNFYGNLIKSSDRYLVNVLEALDRQDLTDDTLVIRTADHGEMGLAHGGLRQKNFNMYEEALRVPLLYSNPRLWPRPRASSALVSHVDFLPTLASLVRAPRSARAPWQGRDYSGLVLGTRTPSHPPQDYIVFTFDDYQSGQASGPYPRPPNHIVALREQRWKIARYYDVDGNVAQQWEMYDLRTDRLERRNLAAPGYRRTAAQQRQYLRLRRKLARVEATRLQPLRRPPFTG